MSPSIFVTDFTLCCFVGPSLRIQVPLIWSHLAEKFCFFFQCVPKLHNYVRLKTYWAMLAPGKGRKEKFPRNYVAACYTVAI